MLPVRFVLLRPRVSENLGAAARALKNFGLSDWCVVDSQVTDLTGAERMAVQAEDVLAARKEATSLEQAVSDCVWVVGTSSRKVKGKRRLTPREVAQEAVTRGPCAIVFGDERSGLTNEEIDRCHDLSAIPTDAAQPSVNLAQSILLYAYELRLAELEQTPKTEGPRAIAATAEDHERLIGTLKELLSRGNFLKDEGRPGLKELAAPWVRSRLTRSEAQLWMAAMKTLLKELT